MDLSELLFVDVEASGLAPESYPIEVGWADLDGKTGSILIRPALGWTHWDSDAELMHCISRARLAEKGTDPTVAAKHVAEIFKDRTLISDSPDYDGRWLAKLFGVADLTPPRLTHARSLIQGIASDLKRTQLDWTLALEQADNLAPVLHRAAADALNMATAVRLFTQGRSIPDSVEA
ncbi:MAG: hypothetical protein EPN20_15730 [Magnetospirillum sp.]|nr:MAG: hypothetical protein EPN20_15730 [Magnetospirillum sp.]